jgi:hypothetical protein
MLKQEREMEIWKRMSPKDRDYDRYVGRIPYGASMRYETDEGQRAADQRANQRDEEKERSCSCHINPPCSYCENNPEIEIWEIPLSWFNKD